MFLRLCSRAPRTTSALPLPGPPLARDGHRALAAQVGAGDRAWLCQDELRQRPGRDDLAAVLARARPDVEHPVGRPDGLLVVLDDDQRVAQVAQPDQRGDELGVVLLVQADGRLVEDVQDAHQARADLRRQADALRLAAATASSACGRWSGSPARRRPGSRAGRRISFSTWRAIWPLTLRELIRAAPPPSASASVTDIARHLGDVLGRRWSRSSTSGLRRAPPQVGHGRATMNFSSSVLTHSDSVSR